MNIVPISTTYPLKWIDIEVIVVINLYKAITGGDFFGPTIEADYAAKAFVTTVRSQIKGASSDNIIENLAKLGVNVVLEHGGHREEIRSTRQWKGMNVGGQVIFYSSGQPLSSINVQPTESSSVEQSNPGHQQDPVKSVR